MGMKIIELHRNDFKPADPFEDVDHFSDLVVELGFANDYEAAADVQIVQITVAGAEVLS